MGKLDAVLRALRPGYGGHHRGKVERQRVGKHRIGRAVLAEHALRPVIGLDQGDAPGLAAGRPEIGERVLVDREEAAGGAVFRRHVGDGRLILQRQIGQTVAIELDEFADHALLAQHLGDGEHQVGGGDALAQAAAHAEADDLGDEHGDRLAEHGRLGLDAADAPAENGQPVDHGGVAVGADQRIGIGDKRAVLLAGPHGLGEIFEIDLVADAGARRHHAEILEGGLAPAQELVALAVALIFALDIVGEGHAVAEGIDHHRMVDDQIDRHQRVDARRVAAERHHGVAHGSQIDHRRHAGEILHQDPGGAESDLAVALAGGKPGGHGADIVGGDRAPVLVAEQVLEQHLQREGQAGNAGQSVLLGIGQAVVFVGCAPDGKGAPRFEAVERRGHVLILLDSVKCPPPRRRDNAAHRTGSGGDGMGRGPYSENWMAIPDDQGADGAGLKRNSAGGCIGIGACRCNAGRVSPCA